jgi:tetratricopeptide (TPR) repeat protein
MKRTLFVVLLSVSAMAGFSDVLQAKTFLREYTYRASEADSKITARSIALNQVKTALLEEIGVYIESTFNDTSKADKSGLEQLSQQQIVSITAGVTETKILDEKWDGQTYYMKAEITVDIDEVKKKIAEIAKDRDKTKELEDVKKKADEAYKQIELLQAKLAKTEDEKEKLKLQADYQNRSSELTAADWFQMGLNADILKEYDKAILYYQKAVGINPEYADAYSCMGFLYLMKGNNDKAIEMYGKVIRINPNDADAYVGMGAAYMVKGNPDKEIELYEKAISVDPKDAEAYYNMGVAYRTKGEDNKSISCFKKAAGFGDKEAQKYLSDKRIEW